MMTDNIYNRDYEFIPADEYLKSGQKTSKDSLEHKVEEPAKTKAPTQGGFLTDIITDKISFLRQILNEIDTQINNRETLKDSIVHKIDTGICYLRTKLYEIESWELGRNRNIDSRRSNIEQELEALENQKRDETRQSWRDIALLKKEHRQFFHEYRNALRRVKVILPDEFKNRAQGPGSK